jgi:excisionase family DNA binding protein
MDTNVHPTALASQANALTENKPQPRQDPPKGFIDEKELLTRLPISRRTAFNWIQRGKLPVVKIGRRKLFHWDSVEAALLRHQRN